MERSGILQALSVATDWDTQTVVNSYQTNLLGVIDTE